ncbi:adenylyl-sulfate kinase [Dongia soli]|uniref:Adenylyl-sulfate kinase n=1 Tax=Dongia soli TaxID=600628 RepID=A0ABU5EE77_9PROT|nr:adenylyl-sulfate kinase [Dongia soli]MDY0884139.1 adenylyl-sulfate kinase [Dongia soli]
MSDEMSLRDLLRIVIVGHVDHGKSTLVGRLFHDTGSLPEGKLEAIQAMCERRGMRFEWAFLMDAFQSERDQGITIDTSQIWFKSARRDYTIIDAPGHREFLKNMITGAANADAAVMLIDAGQGVQQQSRTHAYLLQLLGVRQIVVVVNKMDLADFAADRFAEIETTYRQYLADIGMQAAHIIPVVARDGDNIVKPSDRMTWYRGKTLVEALDGFVSATDLTSLPLRFPVQDVYKFDERRILAGRVLSGRLRVGDRLLFSPSNKTARVASIEAWSAPAKAVAEAGESVGITLDEQLFIERGDLASHEETPPIETNVFQGRLFWLPNEPLRPGASYRLRLQTREVPVTVQEIKALYDVEQLTNAPSDAVPHHGIADVVLRSQAMLALDRLEDNPKTGRFVLTDGVNLVAGGTISMDGYPNQRQVVTIRSSNLTEVEHTVTHANRAQRNGHRGGVLWFTGLSGAGKSTIAMAVERELFRRGFQVYVLDGDNVRRGLNANLGFSPEDRAENIRRIGEVAALFADAGMVVITAFISPYRSDRQRARNAAHGTFHEVYIKADLAACELRDPKGLYRRARQGEIGNFTGISAPYELPDDPELVVDTQKWSVEACVQQVIAYVERTFRS